MDNNRGDIGRLKELLPDNWTLTTISEIGQVITGKTPSTNRREYWYGEIPFITPPDLVGREIFQARRSISKEGLKVAKPLPKGTVLVSCIGYIGKVGIVASDCAVTNQQINAVIPTNSVDSWFLLYLFQHLKSLFIDSAAITTVPILSKHNFEVLPIRIPPINEQRAIAYVLRTVQRAKEATEKVITAARQLKQSLMRHLFTYGPVPFHEADQVELKETRIGKLPLHWREIPFGEIASFKNGINFKADQKGRGLLTVDVLNMYRGGNFIQMEDLYRVDIEVNESYLLKRNDIIFVRSSLKQEGVGWAALFPGHSEPVTFCGFLIRSRIDNERVLPEFLVNYFRLPSVRQMLVSKSGKVAITNISQGNLKTSPVFLPPIEEQKEIVEILSFLDEKILNEERRYNAINILFLTLLHHLMTGQIRVHDLGFPVTEEAA
ncbi:MAG: restriction endonuclease subunit S [Deltaproteobacteria bacterium]|nr:restriction endonuclease subunit S [Deltaproteobacteria bacterium]